VQSFFLMNLTSFHLVMNQQAEQCAAALWRKTPNCPIKHLLWSLAVQTVDLVTWKAGGVTSYTTHLLSWHQDARLNTATIWCLLKYTSCANRWKRGEKGEIIALLRFCIQLLRNPQNLCQKKSQGTARMEVVGVSLPSIITQVSRRWISFCCTCSCEVFV
jgi:hypothetical protein